MSNRWTSNQSPRLRAAGAALLALLAAGCAAGLPAPSLQSGAASLDAVAAPQAEVGVALSEDPPLPGESTRRWPELTGEQAPRAVEPGRAGDILQQPLTADASVRLALANNRGLRASLRELGIADGQLLQAGLLPNPTFGVDLRRSTAPGEGLRPAFSVEYDLTSALLTPLRTDAARADLEAVRYRSAAAVVATGYEVRSAFLALQAALARLGAAVRVLDAFAAGRDATRALFAAGNVPELDLSSQEAAYQEARLGVAELELEVVGRRESVNRLLGLHGEQTSWSVEGTLAPAPAQLDLPADLERNALRASLELAEMRSGLDATARRALLSRTQGWLPDVSVIADAEHDGPGWTLGAGARFTLPLFDHRQGTTRALEAERDVRLERYQGAAIDIRSAAREARARLAAAHARARHLQEVVVPARRRVMEQALLQYNAMQIGVFQLLQARRDQLASELGYQEALRDFWTARAAVDALLAGRRVGLPALTTASTPGLSSGGPSGGH